MSDYNAPFNINDLVEIKVLAGRLAGRWIPARVIRIHKHRQKLDLCIPNNMIHNVLKYAVQVPFKSVRRPKYRFKEGDSIWTKILRGKRQGVQIPARILRVNEDGTYDLLVDEYKKLQVTRYALNVPGEYLRPSKTSHNPFKPTILLPTTVRELEFKESLKAKQKWEQRRMQERRPENMEKDKLACHRKKRFNNRMKESKSSAGESGKQSDNFIPSLMIEDKKPTEMRRYKSNDTSYKKISPGGNSFKMSNTLVWSSPNTPNQDTSGPAKECTGALLSLEKESQRSAIPSQKVKGIFESHDTRLARISKPKGKSKGVSHKQTEEKPAADDDASSTYSDWDHMYESEVSESEERKDDSDSVISDDDWGLEHMHNKEPTFTELTSSVHQLDNSAVTSPGQSMQSWVLRDLYHSQSEPLRGPEHSYDKIENLDSARPSYDFVDSFLPLSKKSRSSSAPDRIVTIGVSKHRVQFSKIDFDTPVENIASWLSAGALKSGKGVKSPGLVNNISFNGKMIPIRNNSSGQIGELDLPQLNEESREYSLRDVLGKSLDASRQGLAFFVGPVNGRMSYKMSVLDVDKIHQARESQCPEIKEQEETFKSANLADIGYSEEV